MQNPFAHAHFRDRSRPFIVVVLLLVGLVTAGGLVAKPMWRRYKAKQALRFVAQARSAMAATNFVLSKANLVAAAEMSPFLPEVFRAGAEHFTLLGRPYGLQLWEQLEGTGEMTLADRVKWAGLALDHRSYQTAKRALAPFAAVNSSDPEVLRILSGLYAAAGNRDAARQTARDACAAAPNRTDLELHLAKLDLENPNPEMVQEGVSRLMSLVVRTGPDAGLAAVALLAPEHSRLVSPRLLARLVESIPASDPVTEMARLVVRCRGLSPDDAQSKAAEFLREQRLTADSPQFMTVILGLLSLKEYALVTRMIPEDLAVGGEDLGSIRLEALFRINDWTGVESLLNRSAAKISKPVEATYRAMLAHQHGRTNELGNLWRAAIAASQRSPDLLEIVAERAEFTGALEEATQAWREMLPYPDAAIRAAREMLRLVERTHNREAAYQAYRRMVHFAPADGALRLQVALHQLLLRLEEADAEKTLSEGEQAFSDPRLYRVTAALAQLRQGHAERAVHLLGDFALGANDPPLWRVIHVAALSAAGMDAEARRQADGIVGGQLSAPEFALVKDTLKER